MQRCLTQERRVVQAFRDALSASALRVKDPDGYRRLEVAIEDALYMIHTDLKGPSVFDGQCITPEDWIEVRDAQLRVLSVLTCIL